MNSKEKRKGQAAGKRATFQQRTQSDRRRGNGQACNVPARSSELKVKDARATGTRALFQPEAANSK